MWKERREQILITCVIGVFFLVAAVWCRPVFYLNDDVTMRSILSGSYIGVPDGHAVYMKYPLTGILSLLYRIVGMVPWLELFFAGCFVWALSEIVSLLKWKILGGIVGFLFLLPFYLYMHYTVIAAVLAGTAVFLVCTDKKAVKPVLFWLLAWMVRSQVAYLSLPFLGVALLGKLFTEYSKDADSAKGYLKNAIKASCVGGICFLLCAGVHSLCYAGEDWQNYLQYNEARTALYDYTNFLSTDSYAESYAQYGMTAEEFAILDSYNTMLDASVDEIRMAEVAKAVSTGMKETRDSGAWLKECVKRYYYQIRYPDNAYVVLWLGAVVFLAVVSLGLKKWSSLLLLACLEGGRSLIWIFLLWKDRFPERVELSLYVVELFLLMGLSRAILASAGKWLDRVVAVVCCVAIGLLGWQIKVDYGRAYMQKNVQEEWNVLKEYCGSHPETLYLADVFSVVEYGGLFFEKDTDNILLAGGWMSASPLAEERLAAYEAEDGARALCENEKVAFLAEKNRDIHWLEAYLQKRFGDCDLQPEKEIICGREKILVEYRVITEE